MTKLSRKNSIVDNKKASNQSFLYFLHEEGRFDEPSFLELYHDIKVLDSLTLHELRDLYFIHLAFCCDGFLCHRQSFWGYGGIIWGQGEYDVLALCFYGSGYLGYHGTNLVFFELESNGR